MGQDPSGRGQLGRGRSAEVRWNPSSKLAHPHERRSFGAGSVPEVENPSLSPCKFVAVSPRPRPLQGPTLRDWLGLSRPRTGSSDSKALRAALPSASKPRSVLGPAPQASLTEGDAWRHQADVQDPWDDPDIAAAWDHRSRGGHALSALRSQGWPPLCQAHDVLTSRWTPGGTVFASEALACGGLGLVHLGGSWHSGVLRTHQLEPGAPSICL